MHVQGPAPLTLADTHGILTRPGQAIIGSSERLGWRTLFASRQVEQPYADHFAASDDHLIVMHLSGPVTVERDLSGDRKRARVHRGGLFILPAGRDFGVSLGGALETVHIYVRGHLLRAAASELGADARSIEIVPRLGVHDPVIEQMAATCCTMLAEGQSDFFADAVARILAARIIAEHSTVRLAPAPERPGLGKAQIDAVRELVRQRIEATITVETMAAALRLPVDHFSRRFKRATGKSPYQFVLDERLDRARELLATGTPIADVAILTGFSHQEHLTRMFGRRFGITPGRFRKAASN